MIKIKDNGYKPNQEMRYVIDCFNRAAELTFCDDCLVEHFYYGDKLDMITVYLPNENRSYGDFNLTEHGVHFNGHTCTHDEYALFASLTWNDSCFPQEEYGCLFDGLEDF